MRESLRAVGQHVMVGFDGFTLSSDLRRLIRDYAVGHVILFARNVDGPVQVAELVREIQEFAKGAGHDTPILVAVDQEGGRVARMKQPWTLWPPLRGLGRIGSEDMAKRMGAALAAECAACGIRLDFAPIVDVDTNPQNPIIADRSFGADAKLVGRMGAAMIRGLQEGGVAACAKHFPGHGDTNVDSHLDLPVIEHPRSRLEEVEIPPFKAAIAADVATIMTAHILMPELDDTVPATLSPKVVKGMLRDGLGYRGVIVSDDLEMKAVANLAPPDVLAIRATLAGCDMLPLCSSHDAQVTAIEGVVRALESKELAWGAFDDSTARLMQLKKRFLLPYAAPDPRAARAAAGIGEALAREIAEQGGLAAV
jgi:beta-N-acetylhexosaminidase